ncbi:MAG TPA: hypothetical protein VEZ70_11265 [Allosphingosinicella sp.]|nr:hypothetical protein [Allosphingosinicella sp.]
MNKFMIALAATTAFAAAAPAAAQYGGGSNIQLRTDQLQAQLQAGVQSGAITRAEAMPLREQLRQLVQLERQYSRDGLNAQERSTLQARMANLRQGIRMAERNGDGRYNDGRYNDGRYGDGRYDDGRACPPGLEKKNNGCLPPGQVGRDDRDNRWNEQDRYGRTQMMDRNRDGYDDRDLNRDGRIDEREWRMAEQRYGTDGRYDDRDPRNDDRYGRGDDRYGRDDDRYGRDDDRYENRDAPRGGIGGVIDNLLGGGGLRVGQRVSGNLGPVPSEYRNQYRDGNGVYYRSDNRAIYQIDARTDTVVRIYSLNR